MDQQLSPRTINPHTSYNLTGPLPSPSTAASSPQSRIEQAPSATSPEQQTSQDGPPAKKKQKRNKPTLSCEECVERKTKVRFGLSEAIGNVLDTLDFSHNLQVIFVLHYIARADAIVV